MRTLHALFAFALLATAAGPARAGERERACVSVAFGSEQKNGGAFDDTFSATQIVDLDLSILVSRHAARRFGEQHPLEFRVFTPKGHLYQTLSVVVTADAGKRGREVRLHGHHGSRRVTVFSEVVHRQGRYLKASARLPVAGTPMIANGLYGAWTVQAFVDGEAVPCAPEATFTLTP